MPIRVEQLASDPHLFVFYDVISDKEISTLKDMAKPLV